MKKNKVLTAMVRAFPNTLPVMAGYIFLGIAYGILMTDEKLGVHWTALCSLIIYGGSCQFALIDLLTDTFAPLTVALMVVLVQARHIFYGLTMLEEYGAVRGGAKNYLIFALTDETYSLVVQTPPADVDRKHWYLALSVMDQCYWVIGSVLGALLGQIIPVDMTGIDFSMTALFTVIVTEQAMGAVKAIRAKEVSVFEGLFPALLGLISTVLCLVTIGTKNFLVASMACMLVCFFLRYTTLGKEEAA